MAPTPVHTKLLTQAAREVLRPLGLTQRGRSRSWIDDHGWWLGLVDFDSSSFAAGSYLNVGVMWLWDDEHAFFHYDVGGRVDDAGFVEFESEAQFAPAARRLVDIAAGEVSRYRMLFPDLRAAAEFLDTHVDESDRHLDAVDAGIAWGALGEMVKARRSFARAHEIVEDYWRGRVEEVAKRSDAARAAAAKQGVHLYTRTDLAEGRSDLNACHSSIARYEVLLSEPELFRAEVVDAVDAVRAELKLSPADALPT